jgi:enterochelin esterase-like enzyme
MNKKNYQLVCFVEFLILLSCFLLVLPVESSAQRPWIQPIESPIVHPDRTVTFYFKDPGAKKVELNTQFIKGNQALNRDSLGVWSVTLGPVEPDIYPYNFVIDGISVADPNNASIFPNEGFKNSLVEIPGEKTANYSLQDVPHGKLTYCYYYSKTMHTTRPMVIYTPPGYEKNPDKKYPLLVLLHGTTDTEETWTKVGRVNFILDNLINKGKAKPMIVVMPYGRAYPLIAKESGSIRNWDNLQLFSNDFLNNIFPFVKENYRILDDKNYHAIAGFSGGGGQALFIGLSNPGIFAWVCGFAPGMLKEEFDRNNAVAFANTEATNSNLKLFWIGCGREDGLYGVIKEYLRVLDEKKIKHTTYISEGGHTWMNCRLYLSEISVLLFQN